MTPDPEATIEDCVDAIERLVGPVLSEQYRVAIENTLRQLLGQILARRQGPQAVEVPVHQIGPAPGRPQAPGTVPPVGKLPPPFVG